MNDDKKEIGIYNPLPQDFVRTHNLNNKTEEVVVKSREIAYFPLSIARYIEKHLYDAILNHRGINGIKAEADGTKEEILKEIRVLEE